MKNLLMNKIKEITKTGLPFMEGLEKGDVVGLLDEVQTVNNFGFLEGTDGKFVVFTIKENDTEFYFGSSVVTEAFVKIDEMITEEEKVQLLEEGLPIILKAVKSKNKRTYTKVEFYPTV